jgi:hypothetical protein
MIQFDVGIFVFSLYEKSVNEVYEALEDCFGYGGVEWI